jgi:hypothetical protein
MSAEYDKVKAIVDGYERVGTDDPLHHTLVSILYMCDSADYFGDEIDVDDIRNIVADGVKDLG